jgi:penicillin-binding protein 2
MKPLSVLIGLNEGLFTPSTIFQDTGVFYFGKKGYQRPITNSQGHVYGNIDGAGAIEHSSNPFMAAMVGNKLYMRGETNGKSSVEIWDDYMKQFGLGVLTESGLPNESKGVIEYFSEAERGSAQSALIFASFGQQGRYTTLQLAQYATMLANRGKRLKPQFVNEIKDAGGKLIQTFKPEILNTVDIPAAYWKEIEDGMSKVSSQGFEGFEYSYRRKTGTSEQDVASRRAENAVFIAYAPAENPKLAVAVIVPDGGFGGYGASPIARQIFDAYDEEVGLTGVPKKKPVTTTDADGAAGTTGTAETAVIGANAAGAVSGTNE